MREFAPDIVLTDKAKLSRGMPLQDQTEAAHMPAAMPLGMALGLSADMPRLGTLQNLVLNSGIIAVATLLSDTMQADGSFL